MALYMAMVAKDPNVPNEYRVGPATKHLKRAIAALRRTGYAGYVREYSTRKIEYQNMIDGL